MKSVPAKAGKKLRRVEHELPTAAVGRFVASADRPPPWTTLPWLFVSGSMHAGWRNRIGMGGGFESESVAGLNWNEWWF